MRQVFTMLAVLGAVSVSAQTVSRGDALRHREFRTYADMTLYVDSASGDDSFPCSLTLPCATYARAESLVPYILDHDVLINVAAGTYASGLTFADHHLNATFSVTGEMTTVASATVSVYGLAEYGPSAVFVSGAGWTVDAFAGKVLHVTAGTGIGTLIPIASNTSDTLVLAGEAGTPLDATSVFNIEEAATIFTCAGKSCGTFAASGSGIVYLNTLGFSGNSGFNFQTTNVVAFYETTFVNFFDTDSVPSGLVTMTSSAVNGLMSLSNIIVSQLSNVLVRPPNGSSVGLEVGRGARLDSFAGGEVLGDVSQVFLNYSPHFSAWSNVALDCGAGTLSGTSWTSFAGTTNVTRALLLNCALGAYLVGPTRVVLLGTSNKMGSITTTAASLDFGASMVVPSSTANSADFLVDGTTVTDSDLTTATFVHGARGSTASR